MYRQTSDQTNLYLDPQLFPGAPLNPSNRWVRLSEMILWDSYEQAYKESFADEKGGGRPAKTARMALGAHIIKERYHLSDIETVKMIRENPYLQFFVGLTGFSPRAPFGASTMTRFRRRLSSVVSRDEIIAFSQKLPK